MNTVKRITKVLTFQGGSIEYRARFAGDEPYRPENKLATELALHLPTWERLGKPKRIRVTITRLY